MPIGTEAYHRTGSHTILLKLLTELFHFLLNFLGDNGGTF